MSEIKKYFYSMFNTYFKHRGKIVKIANFENDLTGTCWKHRPGKIHLSDMVVIDPIVFPRIVFC